MKNLLVTFLAICTLLSCSKQEDLDQNQLAPKQVVFDAEKYPQKWQLVKMNGSIPNSETTGAAMEWQEYYLLNSDGTFKKLRERDGALTEVSGTYVYEDLKDGKYLILTYGANNSLIGSCTSSELKETLWLKPGNKLWSTWSYCDGPGLEYQGENVADPAQN